jgi:transposase
MTATYQRLEVVALWNAGYSYSQIEDQTGKGKSYVYKWVQRHEQVGSVERQVGSGRPQKLTPEVLEEVLDSALVILHLMLGKISPEEETV